MDNYILLTEKKWHQPLFESLGNRTGETWHLIAGKSDFNKEALRKIKPVKIFIPHWSYIIPADIYDNYECIVFHMTDLPYGRGGSPLQNLIVREKKDTTITSIKVTAGIDTGDIYNKKSLGLEGSAQEIFLRSVPVIREMIEEIIEKKLIPYPQSGKAEVFKRRTPGEGDISGLTDIDKIYDYIRMLDADSYPNAFIENEKIRIEFFNAKRSDKKIEANVRIIEK